MALILPRRKAGAVDIADVFSTDLYTGNGSSQTITNGIDLSGEGGLVWIKRRDGTASHALHDTFRGANLRISSNSTAQQIDTSVGATGFSELSAFNADGYDIGNASIVNANTVSYAAWTFRKSPSFFDVVTYTGDGTSNRAISHNLGVVPGMVVIKRTDGGAENWTVDHRSLTQGWPLFLNLTSASASTGGTEYPTEHTDTNFYVGSNNTQNGNTFSYVAYLFAHDTTDNGVIQCGSYTGNGSTSGPTVTLGWEPQWVMIKRADNTSNWLILDQARTPDFSGNDAILNADTSFGESASQDRLIALTTGFQIVEAGAPFNVSGGTYIYCAIRKEGV